MSEKICPLYKKALIEGLVSYFGDNSAVDEYVKGGQGFLPPS